MFASAGRAVARRFPSAATTQLFSQPLAIRPALATRSFSVSSRVLFPPAKAASTSTTTTTAATKKKKKKQPATKKKTAAKSKAAKKPKDLTPEQVARAEKRKERSAALKARAQKKAAHELALLGQEPKALPSQPWPIFIAEQYKRRDEGQGLPDLTRQLADSYKNLSASELETLTATAERNKATNAENYRTWVHSHPPEAIWLANKIRRRISRDTSKKVKSIEDDRLPKALLSPYNRYFKEQYGIDRGSSSPTEHFKDVSAQWKRLSEAEKRPYYEEYENEKKQQSGQAERLLEKVKELEKGIRETAKQAAKSAKTTK